MKTNLYTEILKEVQFGYSLSGGPGGQHVNRTETKCELKWNYMNSSLLSSEQKQLIGLKLKNFINSAHEVRITSQKFRSKDRNKDECLKKLTKLLKSAFYKKPPRKKTKPSKGTLAKNRAKKQAHSEKKQNRRKIDY